jgi:hypothetical protein
MRAPPICLRYCKINRNGPKYLPTIFPYTYRLFATCQTRAQSSNSTDLGVRSTSPPDSIPGPSHINSSDDEEKGVSDQEWELRTGGFRVTSNRARLSDAMLVPIVCNIYITSTRHLHPHANASYFFLIRPGY